MLLEFFKPYRLKKGCRVILGHTSSESTDEHQFGGGDAPYFPEMRAVQCAALVLPVAAHVVQVDTPSVKHLSSSESDKGKSTAG